MDTTVIEFMRNFALAHNEVAFAHLCTEALAQLANPAGEQWAVERIAPALSYRGSDEAVRRANLALDEIKRAYAADVAASRSHSSELWAWGMRMVRAAGVDATVESTLARALSGTHLRTRLDIIRATDTTRPDGAIARRIEV